MSLNHMNIIIVSALACIITQIIKMAVILVRRKRFYLRAFITTGGMPSAHSAIVCSLATSVAMVEGFNSVAFGISAILAFVVMFDAAGLRRAVGQQAVVLNRIVKELMELSSAADFEHDSREIIGHTILQVVVGAVLGAAVSFLWFALVE